MSNYKFRWINETATQTEAKVAYYNGSTPSTAPLATVTEILSLGSGYNEAVNYCNNQLYSYGDGTPIAEQTNSIPSLLLETGDHLLLEDGGLLLLE